VVLGGGPEEAQLKALATELKIAEAVTFTGYVDNRELPRYLSESTVFVNASNVDNMPISILEAFAAGLPVVSTEAGGIPHLVAHGISGLLVPLNDHGALAAAVGNVIEDPALAERLARAGRAAAEDFAWESVFPRLMAVYGKAPAGQQKPADACPNATT
jgi:glycosyltransferase involved in cell wall biosynthesis